MLPKRPEVGYHHLLGKIPASREVARHYKVASHAALSASTSKGGLTRVAGFISPMTEAKGYFFTLGPVFGTTPGVFT
jgi:hypothetical protein